MSTPGRSRSRSPKGALLRDPSRVTGTVGRICSLGVAVALDDFGTGYSSLQHLRKLPISEIKIDRSFVGAMAHNHDDAAIVRSTVDMARALGIRTVAEGVENEYTASTARGGWLHPRPGLADGAIRCPRASSAGGSATTPPRSKRLTRRRWRVSGSVCQRPFSCGQISRRDRRGSSRRPTRHGGFRVGCSATAGCPRTRNRPSPRPGVIRHCRRAPAIPPGRRHVR